MIPDWLAPGETGSAGISDELAHPTPVLQSGEEPGPAAAEPGRAGPPTGAGGGLGDVPPGTVVYDSGWEDHVPTCLYVWSSPPDRQTGVCGTGCATWSSVPALPAGDRLGGFPVASRFPAAGANGLAPAAGSFASYWMGGIVMKVETIHFSACPESGDSGVAYLRVNDPRKLGVGSLDFQREEVLALSSSLGVTIAPDHVISDVGSGCDLNRPWTASRLGPRRQQESSARFYL